ncbi:hypothetical protein C8R46DRAFT_1262588 [Mycena filopes]|nr:hypothetical protein C8R46DRAFT_1262588 [Mycena filopes]
MLLYPLTSVLLSFLALIRVVAGAGVSCACLPFTVPVHVDTLVPKNSTDLWAGLKSNASELRRLQETYDISGTFCEPISREPKAKGDVLQLLVHGFSYTSEYWSPPAQEFRNYSYMDFACQRGLSSLAVDVLGTGLSSRPVDPSDVGYPTASAAVSELARRLKTGSIAPGVPTFKTIIGIGHSAGSMLLTVGGIVEAGESPFAGFILTGALSVLFDFSPLVSARDVDLSRWGSLDPRYLAVAGRTAFYPPDPRSFSPRMLRLDEFTQDVGTLGMAIVGTRPNLLETQYSGHVAKVVGSQDQVFCVGSTRCDDVGALTAEEAVLWPAAKSFEVVVQEGSGHDLNLDFFALGAFNTFVRLVEEFSQQ